MKTDTPIHLPAAKSSDETAVSSNAVTTSWSKNARAKAVLSGVLSRGQKRRRMAHPFIHGDRSTIHD